MAPTKRQALPSIEVLIENLPGNVYRRVRRSDGTYHFEFLSHGLFRQFGIDNERLLEQHPIRFDWIHPDDQARFVADLEVSAATLGLLDHRVRVVGENGKVFWARGIARPAARADGSVVWDGIVIDVTREIEAEAAMRLAKEEADRAHTAAARLVGDVVERMKRPIEAIEALVSTLGGERKLTQGQVVGELRAYCEELRAALQATGTPGGRSDDLAEVLRGRASGLLELTGRQREVFRLAASGLSNKAISQRLGITPGTVKLHMAAVLRATGARRRQQLQTVTQGRGPTD
jgi:DNA-binding CsgD family transcriptional regulator